MNNKELDCGQGLYGTSDGVELFSAEIFRLEIDGISSPELGKLKDMGGVSC